MKLHLCSETQRRSHEWSLGPGRVCLCCQHVATFMLRFADTREHLICNCLKTCMDCDSKWLVSSETFGLVRPHQHVHALLSLASVGGRTPVSIDTVVDLSSVCRTKNSKRIWEDQASLPFQFGLNFPKIDWRLFTGTRPTDFRSEAASAPDFPAPLWPSKAKISPFQVLHTGTELSSSASPDGRFPKLGHHQMYTVTYHYNWD